MAAEDKQGASRRLPRPAAGTPGSQLKTRRVRAGIRQEDAADIVSMGRASLQRLERGDVPKAVHHLARLAYLLGYDRRIDLLVSDELFESAQHHVESMRDGDLGEVIGDIDGRRKVVQRLDGRSAGE